MMLFNRILAWSLGLHVLLLLVAGLCGGSKKDKFVVFGAHSRFTAATAYRGPVPFVGQGKAGKGRGKAGRAGKGGKKSKAKAPKARKQTGAERKGKPTAKQQAKAKKAAAKGMQQAAKSSKKGKGLAAEPLPEVTAAGGQKKQQKKAVAKKKQVIQQPPPAPEEAATVEELAGGQPEEETVPMQAAAQPTEDATSDDQEMSPDDEDFEGGFSVEGEGDPSVLARYQHYVQEEIDRVWRPPVGVKRGTVCTVCFTLNDQGETVGCTILKGSSVLIYDLSIMRAARQLRFHTSLWGKKFTIDFCQ